MRVDIRERVGAFAEDKDSAKAIRTAIISALTRGASVELDFEGVTLATQSFVHALIAEAIRTPELDALQRIAFANCSDNVRAMIEIVVSYCQDDWSTANGDDSELLPPDDS